MGIEHKNVENIRIKSLPMQASHGEAAFRIDDNDFFLGFLFSSSPSLQVKWHTGSSLMKFLRVYQAYR